MQVIFWITVISFVIAIKLQINESQENAKFKQKELARMKRRAYYQKRKLKGYV